jgi:hypothetical protein
VYRLLDVAVGRARRFGRGGDIIGYATLGLLDARSPLVVDRFHRNGEHTVSFLVPALADVFRILDRLGELESGLCKVVEAERGDGVFHTLNWELLPLDLQIALKKAVESLIVAVANTERAEDTEFETGHMLATCNLIVTSVSVDIYKRPERKIVYHISYRCNSHMDKRLEAKIMLEVREDKMGKLLTLDGYISSPRP